MTHVDVDAIFVRSATPAPPTDDASLVPCVSFLHGEGAARVSLAGVGAAAREPGAEHVVGDGARRCRRPQSALTRLIVHEGKTHLAQARDGGAAALVTRPPPRHPTGGVTQARGVKEGGVVERARPQADGLDNGGGLGVDGEAELDECDVVLVVIEVRLEVLVVGMRINLVDAADCFILCLGVGGPEFDEQLLQEVLAQFFVAGDSRVVDLLVYVDAMCCCQDPSLVYEGAAAVAFQVHGPQLHLPGPGASGSFGSADDARENSFKATGSRFWRPTSAVGG